MIPMLEASAALPSDMDCSDERQCLALLETLSPQEPERSQEKLSALLGGMALRPPPPAARLRILEAVRPALERIQSDLAVAYSQRPTSIGSDADRVLARVVSLWRAMARAYAEVARIGSTDGEIRAAIALLCQRCVLYTGRVVVEHFMARREVPAGAWSDVHGYYLSAEELGLASVNVAETAGPRTRYESCAETYAALLLVDLANPYARTPTELQRIYRWSQRFGRAVSLGRPKTESVAFYGLDLNRDEGPRPLRHLSEGHYLRQMGVERLQEAMLVVLSRISDGVSPGDLGLGKDCDAKDARRLLSQMNRLWCQAPRSRRFPRRSGNGTADLVRGFDAIHQLVSGTRAPQQGLRRRASDRSSGNEDEEDYGEAWRIVDEAVAGFRLCRRGGGALGLGDLVGLQLTGNQQKLLCRVNWVMYREDGSLEIGLYLLPGAPQCVNVRPAEAVEEGRWRPAFLLPGLSVLNEAPSLVLPQNCYEPLLELDVRGSEPFRARLDSLSTEGPNFERARFTRV